MIDFDLTRPCPQCPFRTDIEPFLTRVRAEEIATAITDQDKTFSCHKTVDYSEGGDGATAQNEQHCAGALILLEHMKRPNQMMRIMERIGLYHRHRLDMQSPVYTTTQDWIEAHPPHRRRGGHHGDRDRT